MKKLAGALLAAAVFLCGNTFAAQTVHTEYGEAGYTISGVVSKEAGRAVTVTVYPQSMEGQAFSDGDIEKLLTAMAYTDEKGAFSIRVGFPDSFAGGSYVTKVKCDGETFTQSFQYFNAKEAEAVLKALSQASGKSAYLQILRDNAQTLGMAAYSDFTAEAVYGLRPAQGYGAAAFYKLYLGAASAEKLVKRAATLDEVLYDYRNFLTVGYEDEILQIEAPVKSLLEQRLLKEDYTKISFSDSVTKNLIVSKFRLAERYYDLEALCAKYADKIGLALGEIPQGKGDGVYKYLFDHKDSIDSIEDIRRLFAAGISAAGESGSSGGGGGGGSGYKPGGISGNGEPPELPPEVTPAPQPSAFSDTAGHWARAEIASLAKRGVISGFPDGSFRPEQAVTRGEFAKLAVCAFGISLENGQGRFSDVSEEAWYAEYVSAAAAAGLVQGDGGRFSPEEPVTRQDAAVILYRYLKALGREFQAGGQYTDQDEISDYAREAVAALSGEKLLSGFDGAFHPAEPATRAMTAKMLYEILGVTEDGK